MSSLIPIGGLSRYLWRLECDQVSFGFLGLVESSSLLDPLSQAIMTGIIHMFITVLL